MTTKPQLNGRPTDEFEAQEYKYNDVKWKDFFTKAKYIPWWILSIGIAVLTGLFTIHHDEIVESLRPISEKIRDTPGGFVIPVLILIAISFPPLFGHELIALLCGVVYGLWIGFAIVAAGTFFGEVGTWYAFKYAFRKRAVKLEKTNLNYGALARFTRDGGFWVVLLIRFSIIPSHFSTAVFSTCDVKFWYFAIATFLTLPKQIILVYVGALLTQQNGTQDNKVQTGVLGLTFLVTVFAGVYIYYKMRSTKKTLLEEQDIRLNAKSSLAGDFDLGPIIVDNQERRPAEGLPLWQQRESTAAESRKTWQQDVYELDDTKRPVARAQEFI